MRPKKKARLQKRADKFQERGEAAFFAGDERKARRNLKKSLKADNKLGGTKLQPAMSDKEFRQRNRSTNSVGKAAASAAIAGATGALGAKTAKNVLKRRKK